MLGAVDSKARRHGAGARVDAATRGEVRCFLPFWFQDVGGTFGPPRGLRAFFLN